MSAPTKQRLMDAPVAAAGRLAHADASRAELLDRFAQALERGLHGLCFSAYGEGQSPDHGSRLDEAQLRARLEIVRRHCRWVRTFSLSDGNDHAPRVAHELGLRTLVGAWLGTDRAENEAELERIVEVARAGHADIVAVGNEVLLREDLGEDELLGYLHRVRRALPGVPIGYVDAYYLFQQHPRVTAACDVILANCYPFWEYCALDDALAYMREMHRRVCAIAGGRPVIISETGWPSAGSAVGAAVPSVDNALRYLLNSLEWTEAEGIELFWFAAFDEAWKAEHEGDRGVSWGLWDAAGRLKYGR